MKNTINNRLLSMERGHETNGKKRPVKNNSRNQNRADNRDRRIAVELATSYDFNLNKPHIPWGSDVEDDKFQANIVMETWDYRFGQKTGNTISFKNYGAPAVPLHLPNSKGGIKVSVEFNLIYDHWMPANWDHHTGKFQVHAQYETNSLGEIEVTVVPGTASATISDREAVDTAAVKDITLAYSKKSNTLMVIIEFDLAKSVTTTNWSAGIGGKLGGEVGADIKGLASAKIGASVEASLKYGSSTTITPANDLQPKLVFFANLSSKIPDAEEVWVFFNQDKSELKRREEEYLKMQQFLQRSLDTRTKRDIVAKRKIIKIQAMASEEGNAAYNHQLARKRAEFVMKAIIMQSFSQLPELDVKSFFDVDILGEQEFSFWNLPQITRRVSIAIETL